MDCWNFTINFLLKNKGIISKRSYSIFSEIFPNVSLLPKIWITLLKYFDNVEIIHEQKDIFINLKKDEIPLFEEYRIWLDKFQKKWWIYSNLNITLDYLGNKLNNYYCIIPIKKWEWSHFVILNSIHDKAVNLVDNKKWNFTVSLKEFSELIELWNGKYALFAKK